MKKFTLILALVTFAISGFAQTTPAWQNKILKQKEKHEQVVKQKSLFAHHFLAAGSSSTNFDLLLKSSAKQKLDSVVYHEYDELAKKWMYDEKDVYEYDDQLRTLRALNQDWKETSKAWETDSKTEFIYGNDGKISSMIMYDREDDSEQLLPFTKAELYYSPDGKVDSMLNYEDEPKGTWTLSSKQYYFYNASGQMIKWELWTIQDDKDEPDYGKWMYVSKFTFEYNSAGNVTKQSTFMNLEDEELLLSESVLSYNSADQLISEEKTALNYVTFELEKSDRTTYQYNTNGDIAVEIYSDWDKLTQTWEEEEKYENTYGTLSSADVIYPNFEMLFLGLVQPSLRIPNKAITSDKTFEKSGDSWVETDKSTYYYSPAGSTGIDELARPTFTFYPNPANENITLKWSGKHSRLTLQVFQISGAMVLEQIVFADEEVSVAHLQKGMYILKLSNGQQSIFTKKLVKN